MLPTIHYAEAVSVLKEIKSVKPTGVLLPHNYVAVRG